MSELTKQERKDARESFQRIAARALDAAREMTKESAPLGPAARSVVEIQEMGIALLRQLIADIKD